jgi:pimeloyl-ACP methyl ester carboxylesterase
MMRRLLALSLLPWAAAACSGGDASDAAVDAGADAGVVYDGGLVDAGFRYDGGAVVTEDAGPADPATLLDQFEQIGGVRTYIRIRGTRTSTMPPVVVLNAGPMLGHDYLVAPLDFLLGPGGAEDPDRLLVFYDMRATGRSGFGAIGSATVSIDSHVLDLDAVLDYVDAFAERTGPVDVLANGYGTAVASLYTVAHPERISRMIFAAPYPSWVEEQAIWNAEWNSRLSSQDRERLNMIREWQYCLEDIPRCSRDVWNIMGPTWMCPENRAIFQQMSFPHVELRPYFFFVLQELLEAQYDHRPLFPMIDKPVTVISGPCDPIPATAAASYAAGLPRATHHILPGTGHFPMTEAPAEFQRIVRRALTY